ncbi:hypothetical protein QAD02_003000 [Eretmocerus hayati]|uniref:Uncharacterized protein n=1 Tax=Eretmocerus hayati TaxID=131215 RepID=A0ACC2NM87_9HYME|nr:hypothetical protein QAD02_003000 [Eretmocerus hayati]
MASPRLPPEHYERGFKLFQDETKELFGNGFNGYFECIQRQWFQSENAEAVCVPELEDPTNNDTERHHAHLPPVMKIHPAKKNHFRDVIQVSRRNWVTFRRIDNGEIHVPKRSPAQMKKLEGIESARKKFNDAKEKTDQVIMDFLDQCSTFEEEYNISYVPGYLLSCEDLHEALFVYPPDDVPFDEKRNEFHFIKELIIRLDEEIEGDTLDLANNTEPSGGGKHEDSSSETSDSSVPDITDLSEPECGW